MIILTLADLREALNLKVEDIAEIKQIADNRIKINWVDGISEIFITNKPIKLTNNRLRKQESVLI